jgi:hypothetical protein
MLSWMVRLPANVKWLWPHLAKYSRAQGKSSSFGRAIWPMMMLFTGTVKVSSQVITSCRMLTRTHLEAYPFSRQQHQGDQKLECLTCTSVLFRGGSEWYQSGMFFADMLCVGTRVTQCYWACYYVYWMETLLGQLVGKSLRYKDQKNLYIWRLCISALYLWGFTLAGLCFGEVFWCSVVVIM